MHQLGRHQGGEAEGGLVQEEHRRLGDQRSGHRQHLAFAAGEFRRVLFSSLAEYRKLFVLFIETLLQVDLGHHRAESKILLHGEFTDDAAALGHVTNTQSGDVLGPFVNQAPFVHCDRPGLGLFQTTNRAQQRRFARSVGAEHGRNPASLGDE